jgi:hypothetical protein
MSASLPAIMRTTRIDCEIRGGIAGLGQAVEEGRADEIVCCIMGAGIARRNRE